MGHLFYELYKLERLDNISLALAIDHISLT